MQQVFKRNLKGSGWGRIRCLGMCGMAGCGSRWRCVWFFLLLANAWLTMLSNAGPTMCTMRKAEGLRCSATLDRECSPTLGSQRAPFARLKSYLRAYRNMDLDYAPVWSRQVRN